MPVSTNSYGASSGVEALIGDIVVSRVFNTTSIPNLVQVETEIDAKAADLNVELMASGYSVPVSTGDPIVRRWLQGVNEKGAAAAILGSMPLTAFAANAEDAGSNRMEMYMKDFTNALKRIRDNRVVASRSQNRMRNALAGSRTDSDGNVRLPLFSRGAYDYPGSRSLTE